MRRLSDIPHAEADPPIVAELLAPLLELRAALGDGTGLDPDTAAALTAAADAAAAAEDPARLGTYALESTGTAPDAVPVIRRTGTEVAALADHTGTLSSLLDDAYTTRNTAAARVDAIIADFRRRARPMAAAATSQADIDAIIELAAQSIRDGVSAVDTARGEMDGHRRRAASYNQGADAPRVTVPHSYRAAPGVLGAAPAVTDPAAAAQIALNQALIAGGVQLGTAAIDAGVQIGTRIVDGIVQVATHGIDTGAALAEQAITTAAAATDPATAPGGPTGDSKPAGPTGTSGLFAGLGAPAPKPDTPTTPAPAPKPSPVIPPTPKPDTPSPSTPAPPPPPPNQAGAVLPPVGRPREGQGQELERPRRAGQLGLTTPAEQEQNQ